MIGFVFCIRTCTVLGHHQRETTTTQQKTICNTVYRVHVRHTDSAGLMDVANTRPAYHITNHAFFIIYIYCFFYFFGIKLLFFKYSFSNSSVIESFKTFRCLVLLLYVALISTFRLFDSFHGDGNKTTTTKKKQRRGESS